eukprot:1141296-Pelagomonas_calceolata.AAC.4
MTFIHSSTHIPSSQTSLQPAHSSLLRNVDRLQMRLPDVEGCAKTLQSALPFLDTYFVQEHQLAVVNCLEDPDDTLKLKTLELLYKMTRTNNVEVDVEMYIIKAAQGCLQTCCAHAFKCRMCLRVIVERMMSYLRTTIDEHIRRDISRKGRCALVTWRKAAGYENTLSDAARMKYLVNMVFDSVSLARLLTFWLCWRLPASSIKQAAS